MTVKPSGSTAALDLSDYPTVHFDADLAGLYVAQLIVNDGRVASAPDTVQVNARDNVPTVLDDTANVAEDSSVSIDVLANDSDPLGGTLTAAIAASPLHGTAQVQGTAIVYAPAPNYFGPDVFTYRASNAEATSTAATVTVTVTPVNDPPVAVDDTATTDQDVAVVVSVLGNDTDVDGDTLTVAATTQPANGSVTTNGTTVTYTPNAGFAGNDSFGYTVSDGALSDSASVAVTVVPGTPLDTTPPMISPVVVGTAGSNGWYRSNVSVTWTVTDPESAISSQIGCGPSSVTTDTTGESFTCTATSEGGNSTESVTIKRDATRPTSIATPLPAPNAAGWNNSDVTVTFSGTDSVPGSGIASCTQPAVLTTERLHSGVQGFCTDAAGNDSSNNAVAPNIRIDKTAPTVVITTPQADATYESQAIVLADYLCSDSLSGAVSCGGPVPSGQAIDTATAGAKQFEVTAMDLAGNVAALTNNYTVNAGDSTPPVITPNVVGTLGGNGWYVSGVEVTWTVEDPESAIDSSTGCERVYVIEDTAGRTITCSATSTGGTTSQSVTIEKDASPPAIRFPTPPPGAGYYLGQSVVADYECTDVGAGVDTCEGTTADGAAVDTATLGEKTYEVTGTDQAGNTQTFTRKYNVVNQGEVIITTVAGGGPIDSARALEIGLGDPPSVAVDSRGNRYIAAQQLNVVVKIDVSGTARIVAGNGTAGFSGDNGSATAASLRSPAGVAVDAAGNLYIADQLNQRIRKVDAGGTITTVAGNGAVGFSGDNGAATAASLAAPTGVALDAAGNLYIADQSNQRIRKVDAGGTITTVAGNGTPGFAGDNGAATAARLGSPTGVAVDAAGNLYIADLNNQRIRKVDAGGTITTVAGNGTGGFSGDNGSATAASLRSPAGVAVDAAGNLYIADQGNQRIRKVDAGGTISTVAGNGTAGYSGDNGPATAASLSSPYSVAVDAAGNLYIADLNNQRIRKVDAGGTISTVAGNGTRGFAGDNGAATAASLANPYGVAVDAAGNLYIADTLNLRMRKVDAGGTITTVAGNGTGGFSGDNGAATVARLGSPTGVAVDAAGNLYIALQSYQRIRKVDAGGTITTVAGNGTAGFSGDNGAATAASLSGPAGVAVDAAGNLYIADRTNQRIRKVDAGGTITTVAGNGTAGFSGDNGAATAASLSGPAGVAVDAAGNLYIADRTNQRIRKVDAGGTISTVAGNGAVGFSGDNGAATAASLFYPIGVAVDAAGNLYIADQSNGRIRKVDADGTITTVAGNGTTGSAGDGGAATAASLGSPTGVTLDAAGNLYVADQSSQRIRKIGPVGGYVDATPPEVTPQVTGTAGTNGWYTSDVTVTWTVLDVESPITSQTGCGPQSVTADTDGVTFTCSATSAGGTTTPSVTVKRDATAPVVQIFTPANDASYEQASVVNADYGCDDVLSGIANCVGPVATGAAIDTATEGAKSFAVTATDAAGNSATVTHNYTVNTAVQSVDAVDDVATTLEDQPITIAVLANDTGGGGPLSITAVTQGANGAVSITGVNVLYAPTADFNGGDTFTYTASDGTTTDVASVSVTITPVNDPPVAVDDSAITAQGVAVSVPVLANDTDVDGDSLSVAAVTDGAHGTVAIVAGAVIYTPMATYFGGDTFTYTVSDGTDTATGTVTVTVTPTPLAAVDDTAQTPENQAVTIAVLDNDTGNNLSVTSVTQGAHGTVTTDGVDVTYTPEDQYNGPDAFTYTVTNGTESATATVSMTVTSVNDKPIAVAGPDKEALETEAVQLVGSGSYDPESAPLTYSWTVQSKPSISANAAFSNPTAADPTVTVNEAGDYVFRLVVDDGTQSSDPDDVIVAAIAAPELSVSDVTVVEGNSGESDAAFTVTLVRLDPRANTRDVLVNYATQSGSALSPGDFTATSGQLTFAAGTSGDKTVVVKVKGDTTFEPDEQFSLVLSGVLNGKLVKGAGTATVQNDDQDPALVVTLTPASKSIETYSSDSLTVTLGTPAPVGGRVVTITSDNPGTVAVPSSVTVAESATTASVSIDSGNTLGQAQIDASFSGSFTGSAIVSVTPRAAAISVEQTLLGIGRSTPAQLTLARPAPVGGVTVDLVSDNPAVADRCAVLTHVRRR